VCPPGVADEIPPFSPGAASGTAPSSHFPRKAEIVVYPPGVVDEIPPFSPGTASGTAPSSHFPRKAEIFVCLPGVADEILSFSPGAASGTAPFKPFPPEGGNICVPAGCGGRNPVFFTRRRLWYSPLQAISPGRRKYLCACRVWRTILCLSHPALPSCIQEPTAPKFKVFRHGFFHRKQE